MSKGGIPPYGGKLGCRHIYAWGGANVGVKPLGVLLKNNIDRIIRPFKKIKINFKNCIYLFYN